MEACQIIYRITLFNPGPSKTRSQFTFMRVDALSRCVTQHIALCYRAGGFRTAPLCEVSDYCTLDLQVLGLRVMQDLKSCVVTEAPHRQQLAWIFCTRQPHFSIMVCTRVAFRYSTLESISKANAHSPASRFRYLYRGDETAFDYREC